MLSPGIAIRAQGTGMQVWRNFALVAVSGFLIYYCYVEVLAQNPLFRYAGVTTVYPVPFAPWIGIAFGLLPLAWLRRSLVQPSDFIVLYLYFFLFLPTCILVPFASDSDLTTQFAFLISVTLAFGMVELRRIMRSFRVSDFSLPAPAFEWLLIGLSLATLALLLWLGEVDFSNINFFDVYERRAELMSEGTGTSPIIFYAGNWGALAITPIMLVYGLTRKRLVMIGLGALLGLVSFLATTFKANAFIPLFTVGYYFLFRFFGFKRVWEIVAFSLIFVCGFSLAVDSLVNYAPFVTWSFEFRLIGNNGFLSAKYLDFFIHMPKGLYADSFGRYLFDPVYNKPIAEVVGESFTSVAGNHANASLWSDGFGNLGFPGIFFAGFELLLCLWLFDSVSVGKSLLHVVAISVPPSFALVNTSVHSTLTSNGALLLFMLLVMMPHETGAVMVTTRRRLALVPARRRATSSP